MLNLTGTEYRPELADGYRWRFDLSQNYPNIEIKVFHKHTGAPVYATYVEISQTDTPEGIRTKVLNKTKQVAGMIRPWNPEYAPMVMRVLRSLAPPKDAVVRTSDEPLHPAVQAATGASPEPRSDSDLRLTLSTLGRRK